MIIDNIIVIAGVIFLIYIIIKSRKLINSINNNKKFAEGFNKFMNKKTKIKKMIKEDCICGHDEVCHIDLMESLDQTMKKKKDTIIYIPCMINGCNCKKFTEVKK